MRRFRYVVAAALIALVGCGKKVNLRPAEVHYLDPGESVTVYPDGEIWQEVDLPDRDDLDHEPQAQDPTMPTEPKHPRVDLTLAQRLHLVVQMNARETGGADAVMRLRRIARCCGLARKASPGGDYYEPMDPSEAKRTGFTVNYHTDADGKTTDRVRGVKIEKESADRPVRCKFTEFDYKFIADKIGEYDIPGSVDGWVGVLEAFGLLDDATLEKMPTPEAIK